MTFEWPSNGFLANQWWVSEYTCNNKFDSVINPGKSKKRSNT